jgi:dipeptidyl aminopeptidase/acylaminoacyl peptidase
MLKLTAGVLPAVDKTIELGIADPNRLYLMGHSLGGFATYGIVTQTNRFKGAVALGGLTNLISAYGQFDTVSRYDEFPHEKSSNQALVIESVLSLRSPPWQDMDRYLRNSPITYVDRVQTPLMIIQGDLDGIPIEQAEEFFMALQRQGKRAELVRYWGEGHVFQSPANIRDMWDRIFAWFDELQLNPM